MRLGELLLDHDLITEEQLERALAEQRRRGGRLGETLVRQEAISEEMLQYHLGYQVTRRKDEERSFGRLRLIRTLLTRFWQLSPRAVPASVLLILLGTALTLTFPWFVKLVVDSEIDAGDARAVLVLAAAMVALQVMAQVALYQANQIFNLANMRLSNHLREGLLEVLFLAHGSTVAARGTGEWLTNLTTDVDNVVERWEHLFITFFKNLFAIIGSCLILILVDPWLTAAVLVLSVLTVWLPGRISNLANPPLMRRPHLIADLVGQLRQALGAGRAIRGFNAQPAVLSDLGRRLTAYYRNDFLMVRPWNVAFNLRLVLGALLLGLVLFIGGRQVIAGRYSLGDLMMVIVTVSMLAPFVDELMQIIIKTNDVKRYWQRCCDVLELNVRRDHPLRRSRQQIQTDGSVTIEGLSFSFGRQRVLERIDLSFEPCRGYAVIGRSGSGKTTLLRLLLRELEPDEGRLLIGSTPISAMSEATLLGLVSHVAQRPVVFAASAYDNIAMGGLEFHERLEPEQVYAAARSAGVHERILTLPEGYDTMLGDGGHPLSGGERQRLAIARALLKSPAVCLLDEPTGSLDRDNEQLVLETILGLAGRCTVIMSTHNPTLIRAMDEVVILEHGRARVVPPGALDADRILALLEGAGAGQDEAEPR